MQKSVFLIVCIHSRVFRALYLYQQRITFHPYSIYFYLHSLLLLSGFYTSRPVTQTKWSLAQWICFYRRTYSRAFNFGIYFNMTQTNAHTEVKEKRLFPLCHSMWKHSLFQKPYNIKKHVLLRVKKKKKKFLLNWENRWNEMIPV